MEDKFSLAKAFIDYLTNNANKMFTAKEIATAIAKQFPAAVKEKINSSKDGYIKDIDGCINQWAAEIGAHKEGWLKKGVYLSSDRPRQYAIFVEKEIKSTTKEKLNDQPEKELYPKLAQFCNSLKIKTLRIDEKTSKKTGGKNYNIWLHADVVGFKDLTSDFEKDTKDCLIEYSDERSYIYSFEVKDGAIKLSQLREYFFQTVSNSSWANYSYLVAENIEESALDELQLLCSSFKIGFIQLNKNEPEESKIVIKAPKTELDWQMMNRIASVNPDFRKFLNNITLVYKGHSDKFTAKPEWDIN